MKTISQASKEYSKKVNGNYYNDLYPNCDETIGEITEKEFQAGAEFVQRWIPVEEELPEDNGEKLLVKMKEEVYVAYYSDKYGWNAAHLGLLKNVTHWRPLNYKL